jgi:hypothetical protein
VEESERYHIMADGLGGYMIEINHAEVADEGEWKCVATSNEGVKGFSTCCISMTCKRHYFATTNFITSYHYNPILAFSSFVLQFYKCVFRKVVSLLEWR